MDGWRLTYYCSCSGPPGEVTVDLYQGRIPPGSHWRMASRSRLRSRVSGRAPGGVVAVSLPARRSRAGRAAGPGSAGGIFANPAGRPEGPGRHSCAAAARSRQPHGSSPGKQAAEGNSPRGARPLIRPARDHFGNDAFPLKEIRNENPARGPRSIHMWHCGMRDDGGVIMTGAGVTRQGRRQRPDTAENYSRNKNGAHRPDARRAGGVLARGQPDWSANPREGVR
jgi:hypothetical protein